jgi:diacylglycerol kinase family enzyme
MNRDERTLLEALQDFNVMQVDAAEVNGIPFVLMASVGFDAEVACDLAGRRGASISHLSYAGPMLRQLRQWRPSSLTVTVDGSRIISDAAGIVVVANCRRYAFGLNPARGADMTDGMLDVVFMPVRSRLDVLGWITRCALGRQMADRRLVFSRGATVVIELETPQRFQIDGDPPDDGKAVRTLALNVRPGVLPVLMPTRGAVTAKDR